MSLRVIRQVRVDSSWIHLDEIKSLGELYPHHALRCRTLRHFDSAKALVQTLNETVEAFYWTAGTRHSLLIPSDLARRFGIVGGDWLEVMVTHARSKSEDSNKTDELVFSTRDHTDLAYDPDAAPEIPVDEQ